MSKERRNSRRGSDYWTPRNKLDLLRALHKYGPTDLDNVALSLPSKSPAEIAAKMESYKKRIGANPPRMSTYEDSKRIVRPSEGTLTAWANALSNSCATSSRATQLPTALRLIAHLEHHPKPEEFNNVDLKALYLHLASVIDNGPAVPLNAASARFLAQTVTLTANNVKNANRHRHRQTDFLQNITRIFPNVKEPQITVVTDKSQALKELLSSVAYNPLEIPDYFLTRTPECDNRQ